MKTGHIAKSALVLLALSPVTACGSAPDSASSAEGAPEATATVDQKVIATLPLASGGEVKFYLDSDGATSIGANVPGDAAKKPFTAEDFNYASLADAYRHFAPAGSVVPPAILDADARAAKAAATATALKTLPLAAPPTMEGPTSGTGPTLYSDADQAWFKSMFCSQGATVECIQAWTWATSHWQYARQVVAIGYVNPGGNTSFLRLYKWTNNQAQLLLADPVAGGNWIARSYTWTPSTYYQADLRDAGSFQLSLAVATAVPTAGVTYQRSGNNSYVTVAGTHWWGDPSVVPYVCNLDNSPNQCWVLYNANFPVDSSGNATTGSIFWDCNQASHKGTNYNAYVQLRNSYGEVASSGTTFAFKCL
jgi:hypothetical protein